jgi:hypothetical protein
LRQNHLDQQHTPNITKSETNHCSTLHPQQAPLSRSDLVQEPSLPTFCTAAKDRFREIAICSSVEPAQTGHSPTFGDAAVRPVNTDIRCNGKISPLANSQFADKLGLCRCSYCSSRALRISGWPFAALQLISQKQSLKRARSTHPIAPSKYSTMLQ